MLSKGIDHRDTNSILSGNSIAGFNRERGGITTMVRKHIAQVQEQKTMNMLYLHGTVFRVCALLSSMAPLDRTVVPFDVIVRK